MNRVVQNKWQGFLLLSDKETTEVDICLTSKAHSLLYWFISAGIRQGVISWLFLALLVPCYRDLFLAIAT
jgi:hypothetical protein